MPINRWKDKGNMINTGTRTRTQTHMHAHTMKVKLAVNENETMSFAEKVDSNRNFHVWWFEGECLL